MAATSESLELAWSTQQILDEIEKNAGKSAFTQV
jgi:hypothetical protein